jgi:beta-N-acetylhexosaminidase
MNKLKINMKHLVFTSSIVLIVLQACAQTATKPKVIQYPKITNSYNFSNFLEENATLDKDVEAIFTQMDDTAIVAQLIMPAVGKFGQEEATIQKHIKARIIGGVLMLNGTKDGFTSMIKDFEAKNKLFGNLPFLYSADAEPSLVNRKIAGSTIVKKANELKTIEEVRLCAQTITKDLNAIGINYNFSPVVDMSPNKTVGFRSFGAVPANIIPWSAAFIEESQKLNVIATAKHFPGHGLVSGDTHKDLQTIDGELKEISNYPKLIKDGVLSIMIAHIAVQNNKKWNTDGLPSTCSEKIVKTLLRDSLKFKGLIVTDAMNMGGVVKVPNCEVKAVDAGCDIVLMPVDAAKAHKEMIAKYNSDNVFKAKVDAAAKRIIRMKLCVIKI